MKKIALLLAAILMFTMVFVACSEETTTDNGETPIEARDFTAAELAIILSHLTDGLVDIPQWLDHEMPNERFEEFLFIEFIPGAVFVVEQGLMGQPHAVVLVQLPDDVDTSGIRQEILDNADPSMWICADADTLEVVIYGRFILFIMTDSDFTDYQAIIANANRYLPNGSLLEDLVDNFEETPPELCDECGYEWCVCPCPECGYDIFECICPCCCDIPCPEDCEDFCCNCECDMYCDATCECEWCFFIDCDCDENCDATCECEYCFFVDCDCDDDCDDDCDCEHCWTNWTLFSNPLAR